MSFFHRLCLYLYLYLQHMQIHTYCKYKPPPRSFQWKSECSFGGYTSPSSPARRKNFGLVAILECLLTCIPHSANPLSHRAVPSVPNKVNHKASPVKSFITKIIISKLSHICNPSIMANNRYRWLLFISAIQKNLFFVGFCFVKNNEKS